MFCALSIHTLSIHILSIHIPGEAKKMDSGVFDRTLAEGKEISAQLYNLIIGAVLCWGFAVNWWMVANIEPATILSISPWIFFIGYFVCCIAGIMLFTKSDKPVVSFIGYNLVVVPFGLVINMVVSRYSPTLVLDAIQLTGLVTLAMMILGTLFPAFFARIGRALFIALLAVIVIELFQIFVLKMHAGWIDWAVALIFCGYIGYDWGRANRIPKTLDNAVDSAAALYMDIINLFLRILSIMGRK